jgi:DNA end-binding protein Ku
VRRAEKVDVPARAMWQARLAIGKHRIGVRMYAAINDRELHLHLLHEKDHARVRQRLANPVTGRTVEVAETRRGVEVEPGRFVVLEPKELSALEPEPSRDVEVLRFVPEAALDHRWYERPYYLGPAAGEQAACAALAAALHQTGRQGIARWTLRKREYAGALRVHEGCLALVALRHADEVIVASDLEAPGGRALEERERKLAHQLIGALTGHFRHEQFQDEYRQRVLELIERKQRGKKIELVRYRAKAVGDDSLADALRRSIKQAG